MGIFDVNYLKMGEQLLPPDKRNPMQRSWISVLLTPTQWVRDVILGTYRQGATYSPYVNSTTYAAGERVIFRYSVYESLVNGNLGNDPLNTSYWFLIQANFIGVDERLMYNGHILQLTYALNKYFGTTFRQPPNISDIFLQAHGKPKAVFVVGGDESNSSVSYRNRSSEFIINGYSFAAFTNLTIWVPLAVFNALDTDPTNREPIIRNFSDQYIVAGITYDVKTY
jgi:hypothetical protein